MLRDKLMEALKNKKRDLSGSEKDAKMDVVKDLRKSAMDSMKDRLDGVKKVSIMSDSDKGLQMGMEKAKELLTSGEMDESEGSDNGPEGESEESEHEQAMERPEDMDYEALMNHIDRLQEIANSKK